MLDSGHIDLFEVTYDAAGERLVLSVKDDTSLYGWVTDFRAPETVSVSLDPVMTAFEIPEGLPPEYGFLPPAGSTVFMLEEAQQEGEPWPGWSTLRLKETLPPGVELADELGAITLAVEVTGPGEVFTWMTNAFGLPMNRYVDTTDEAPDVIPLAPSAHVHTAWAFTAPGDYYLDVTPAAVTQAGKTLAGDVSRYHFHVGASLVPVMEVPLLSMTGLSNPYAVGAPVTLTAVQAPPTALPVYAWYRWQSSGGYAVLPHVTGATATFAASTSGQYAAVLLSGPQGRVVTSAAVDLVVTP